jgi:hypothetical protein
MKVFLRVRKVAATVQTLTGEVKVYEVASLSFQADSPATADIVKALLIDLSYEIIGTSQSPGALPNNETPQPG